MASSAATAVGSNDPRPRLLPDAVPAAALRGDGVAAAPVEGAGAGAALVLVLLPRARLAAGGAATPPSAAAAAAAAGADGGDEVGSRLLNVDGAVAPPHVPPYTGAGAGGGGGGGGCGIHDDAAVLVAMLG